MTSRGASERKLSRETALLKSSMRMQKLCVAGFSFYQDPALTSLQQIRLLYVNFAMTHYPAADETSQLR